MRYLSFLLFVFFIFSCKSDPASRLVERDLMADGIPIKIKAPPDAEVVVEDYGFLKDITVKKGDHFYIQIIESEAINYEIKSIKEEILAEVKEAPFFSKVLSEEDQGFIFEKKIDSETLNYDFRYIKIQGDNQYVFQRGLIGIFSEEDIRVMYEAVK